MKKLLSMLLAVTMVIAMMSGAVYAAPAPAAPLELIASVNGDAATLKLNTTSAFELGALDFTINVPDGCTVTSVSKGADYSEMGAAEPALGTNTVSILAAQWNTPTIAPANKEFVVIEVDVSGAVAETFVFGISITAAGNFNDDTYDWQGVTVTSNEVSKFDGYKATIAADATSVTVGDEIVVNLGANKAFSAAEMTLTYDSALVQYTGISEGYSINSATAGTLEIATYGAEKAGPEVTFKSLTNGNAVFTLTDARFGTGESSETASLEVAVLPAALTVTIEEAEYAVTLPNIFTGATSVVEGGTYTFAPESETGAYYNYDAPTATMGDADVTVVDDGSGWKIENVTGDLVISGTRTPKTYTFNATGAEGGDTVTTSGTPTYGTNFTFTLPEGKAVEGINSGYHYEITSVTIGGVTGSYTYDETTRTATITGTNVKGNIEVAINKVTDTADTVKVTLTGSTDVRINGTATNSVTVVKGSDVTLTLVPEAGYTYTVVVGSDDVSTDIQADNEYTFKADADVPVTVTKTLDVSSAAATKYVQLDGTNMWLVTIGTEKIAGKTYTYGGAENKMFWSDEYTAYCYLVVAENTPAITVAEFSLVAVDSIATVSYDKNVNMTTDGVVDAADAQLVWNMYNVKYAGFTTNVTMEKFLKADVNVDKIVSTLDAQAIVNEILDLTAVQP